MSRACLRPLFLNKTNPMLQLALWLRSSIASAASMSATASWLPTCAGVPAEPFRSDPPARDRQPSHKYILNCIVSFVSSSSTTCTAPRSATPPHTCVTTRGQRYGSETTQAINQIVNAGGHPPIRESEYLPGTCLHPVYIVPMPGMDVQMLHPVPPPLLSDCLQFVNNSE